MQMKKAYVVISGDIKTGKIYFPAYKAKPNLRRNTQYFFADQTLIRAISAINWDMENDVMTLETSHHYVFDGTNVPREWFEVPQNQFRYFPLENFGFIHLGDGYVFPFDKTRFGEMK